MILYHISPKRLKHIKVRYSRSLVKVMYYVDLWKLDWALEHVSRRHKVSADDLYIHVVKVRPDTIRGTGLEGVFYTSHDYSILTRGHNQ